MVLVWSVNTVKSQIKDADQSNKHTVKDLFLVATNSYYFNPCEPEASH